MPKSPHHRKLHRLNVTADLHRKEAELALQGKTLKEIGQIIGRSHSSICIDLKKIRAEWKRQTMRDIGEKIAQEVAIIDEVQRKAWEAFEASTQDRCVTTLRMVKGKVEKTIQTEGQTGNNAFLATIIDCVKRRCDIQGLDQPKASIISGPDGGPVQLQAVNPDDVQNLSDERLEGIMLECSKRSQELERVVEEIASRVGEPAAIEAIFTPVHDVHEAGIPDQLASQDSGGNAGPSEQRPIEACDDLPSTAERQE